MDISRRSALAALGGLTLVPFAQWWESVAQSQAQPVVRHSAHSAGGKRALLVYREAVRLMASRGRADWDGWTVWYKMHKFPDDWDNLTPAQQSAAQRRELDQLFGAGTPRRVTATRLLGACPHGSVDFWAWHRMYLLFFERLCQKLTGEPSFGLPYWDYFASPEVPVEFRSPRGKAANALWHDRWPGYNSATNPAPVPAELLHDNFMNTPDFYSAQAQAENSPHGAMHVFLGAGPGDPPATEFDMTWVGRSARDPIFWLHHCEIDRLWQGWVGAGNGNPATAGWLNNQSTRPGGYVFLDEMTGQLVSVHNRDVLQTASMLGRAGYAYDELPKPRPILFSGAPIEQREIAAADRISAGRRRVDQPLRTSADELGRLRAPALFSSGTVRVRVRVSSIAVDRISAGNIGLYLNLPPGVSGQAARPYLVTVISTFGRAPPGAHSDHGEQPPLDLIFDATDVVARLVQRGELGSQLVASTLPIAGSRDVGVNLEGISVQVVEN